jgi:signal transduction histidine kinase
VEVTADVIHELAEAANRAERLAEELKDLNETKSELIQILAHELFTPITAIQGFALTFAQRGSEVSEDDVQAMAEGTTRATERLQRLVGNLRAAASLDRPDAELQTRPVAVGELLGKVQSEFASSVGRLNLPTDAASLSTSVWAVPELASRALSILAENALDLAPPETSIDVSVRVEGPMTELAVADRGLGVPPEMQEHIFLAFTQADASVRRPHEGLGIGLFLAKRVMEAHHGTISMKDRPGGGSVFSLGFPSAVRPETGSGVPSPVRIEDQPEG